MGEKYKPRGRKMICVEDWLFWMMIIVIWFYSFREIYRFIKTVKLIRDNR